MLLRGRSVKRELVPVDPTAPFVAREFRSSHFAYPWHWHPEIELTLILAGSGTRYVGDHIGPFDAGDLCLIAGETPHCWASEPVAGKPVHTMVIQFSGGVFGGELLALPAMTPIRELLFRARAGLEVRASGAARKRAVAQILELFEASERPVDRLARLLLVLSTLAHSDDCLPLSTTALGPPPSPEGKARAQAVLAFIDAHATRALPEREVAGVARLSPSAFSRFFRRTFGKPYVRHLAEVRVGRACQLLIGGDRSVADIAFEVGFNNLANFNRRFLRLKGMTPSHYRRLAGRLEAGDAREGDDDEKTRIPTSRNQPGREASSNDSPRPVRSEL